MIKLNLTNEKKKLSQLESKWRLSWFGWALWIWILFKCKTLWVECTMISFFNSIYSSELARSVKKYTVFRFC